MTDCQSESRGCEVKYDEVVIIAVESSAVQCTAKQCAEVTLTAFLLSLFPTCYSVTESIGSKNENKWRKR
jgi:hypothetical protein